MSRYGNQFSTPPVVLNLLIINLLFFMAGVALPNQTVEALMNTLGLHFWRSSAFGFWQPLTCMFLHNGFMHLFMNMFALWMFGRTLEYNLGSRRFLFYYLICGIGASLIQTGVNEIGYTFAISEITRNGITAALTMKVASIMGSLTIGASGAVFGVLLAFGMIYPNVMLMLIFPPIPIKAKWFVLGYGVIELLLGISGAASNIAHFAHVGGMIFGFFLLSYWKKQHKIRY